jgi:hypothetical protein
MLPELNLPVNFAGKDGFYWWIGQVETEDGVKNSNRYKVRIVGQHVKSCTAVPVEDLPWAVVMLPVTAPSSEGNSNYSPAKLQKGDWVIGFFMDGAVGQQPIIMGSLQKVTNSTKNNKLDGENPTTECLAFTRYVPPTNPYIAQPVGAIDKSDARPGNTGDVKGKGTNNPGPPPAVARSASEYSPTATSTRFSCANVADVACKDTNKTNSWMENTLTELFGSISSSGGQIGTQLLSSATGTLVDYASAAKGYINRAFGVAKAYLERAKAQMLALIKQGVGAIVKFTMGVPAPTIDPVTGEAVKTKKTGVLGTIIQWLNDQLGLVNCAIADLEQKLLDFLTKLITDLLTSVVNGATCIVEAVISEILSEIESYLTGLIDAILGPLQALLGIIASPLNILGAALEYIFQLLGISCSGNGNKCRDEEQLKNCTGPEKKPGEDDFAALDKLIADIQDDIAPSPLQTSCAASEAIPCAPLTEADVAGGEPNPEEFTGEPEGTLDPPSDPFGEDYFDDFPNPYEPDEDDLPDGEDDTGDTTTTLPLIAGVVSNGFFSVLGTTEIVSDINTVLNANLVTTGHFSIYPTGTEEDGVSFTDATEGQTPSVFVSYSLTSNKNTVSAGESITFTLTDLSETIADGTVFDYVLFGVVQTGDFVGNSILGQMTMNNSVSTKTIQISSNLSFVGSRQVTFNVAARSKLFTINNLVPDSTTPTTTPQPTFKPPVLGTPEVDDEGKIIDIPIEDPGDPYIFPPFIKIYGTGVGASAKAVLDNSGRLSKVLVQRPGRGYTPNKTPAKSCVIDGFVVIRPGVGYTKTPTIYVDGDPAVARAIINDKGNIVDIEVLNKLKPFEGYPEIIIQGNGAGAKAIPSFSCLDNKRFNLLVGEIAPSGVDEVVDCP